MAKKLLEKSSPKLLGVFVLVIGVIATAFLTLTGINPFIKAAPTDNPENIRVTNITDTAFTVTYETQAAVIGTISYGKDQLLGQIGLDDRDEASGNPTEHLIHSITVQNLTPQTKYFFSILSGKTTYLNNGVLFATTTGSQITTAPTSEDPLSGVLTMTDGTKPSEAIVYATTNGGQTLSTLAKPSGLYVIPLNTFRNTDESTAFTFTQDTELQMLAIANGGSQSKVNILASQRNPVPPITLSNNYDFTLAKTPIASTSADLVGFPEFALDKSISATPEISTPKDNQTFTDSQPLLQGQALPDASVAITIHSDVITAQVTADKQGNWSYRPTSPLSPGQHTITITTRDKFGILQTITKTFTIFWSGTQVAEAATPSATPTVLVTPTATPIPTSSMGNTTSSAPTPTPAKPTPTPTITSLMLSPTPAGGKKIPATGSDSVITASIIGLATMGAGVVLFLVTYSGL